MTYRRNGCLAMPLLCLLAFSPTLYADNRQQTSEGKTNVVSNVKNQEQLNEALFAAAKSADLGLVKKMIEQGASVNAKNPSDNTLIESIFSGLRADEENRQEEAIINYLINAGADVTPIGAFGMSYLHMAVAYNMESTASLLLDKGIDSRLKTEMGGQTALFNATSAQMLDMLLSKKAGSLADTDEKGNTLLHNAVGMKPMPDLLEYLVKHIAVDAKNNAGNTALIQALDFDYFPDERDSVVQVLLAQGADVNARGQYARTPITTAVRNRKLKTATIKRLLEAGADVSLSDEHGIQAVHFSAASNFEYLKLLAEHKADLNAISHDSHETPLIAGTRYNRKNTVRYLLERGVDVNIKSKTGKTALNYAQEEDFSDIVALLIEHKAIATPEEEIQRIGALQEKTAREAARKSKSQINSIEDAIRAKDLHQVETYLQQALAEGSVDLYPLAMLTIEEGEPDTFKYLASKGLDLQKKDEDGYSLLHNAVFYDQIEISRYLLQHKLDINALSEDGRSVFVLSSASSVPMIKFLIESGITQNDDTIADEAMGYRKPEVVKYLMGLGYKVDPVYAEHNDYLLEVIANSDVETLGFLFEKFGLDKNKKVQYHGESVTLLHLSVLLEEKPITLYLLGLGADTRIKSTSGDAVFRDVINNGDLEVLDALYDSGADIEQTTGVFHKTPLELAFDLQRVNIIKRLIERGADVRRKNSRDETALHFAAQKGYLSIAKYLIAKGAVFDAKTDTGSTPEDLARENEQIQMQSYLSSLNTH